MLSKSHKPLSAHPNAHTPEELKWIKNFMTRFPELTVAELWRKLREKRQYKRSINSLYRAMRRLGYLKVKTPTTSGYKPKPYATPVHLGEKWQVDVKCVPTWCLSPWLQKCGKRLYQYTCIDEASRERFYAFEVFYSLWDLRKKGAKYLARSNNIPMRVLGYKTPLEKRQEIIAKDKLL